jgi:archaellum component FlaC
MNDLEFWYHWNLCKGIFDGMEKSLITAKQNNPTKDYTEHDNKLVYMQEIQGYLGKQHERVTIIKELNTELNEKLYNIKILLNDYIKENNLLKEEIKQLKFNIKSCEAL